MRISTNMIFEAGVARMSEQQSSLLKTQQQIASNRRLLTPSDDPVAAARALDLSQGQSINAQYGTNRVSARSALNFEEGVLDSITNLIQDVQAQTVAAGNAAYEDAQRGYIATELRSRLDELIGLANSKDGEGYYLFSGYQNSVKPFDSTSSGARYSGDQGQRLMQVGPARQMAISDAGDAVFENIGASGTFVAAKNLPTSALTASAVTVYDASALDDPAQSYDIIFADAGGGAFTYSVANATPPVANASYVSGQPIIINGLQLSISGTPADGETVSVKPAAKQSIFKTLDDLIRLLETPTGSTAAKINLTHGLAVANENLASALDNVLTVRASVGSRLKEIESLDSAGADRDIQYSSTISDLTDLDYVKAISDLTKQKIALEAAQKAFIQTTDLSLFDLL